jgi:hypothetical protein
VFELLHIAVMLAIGGPDDVPLPKAEALPHPWIIVRAPAP